MNAHSAIRSNKALVTAIAVAAVVVALFGIAIPHANAMASVGTSTSCIRTHCIVAKGTGVSGGTSVTKGYFVGTCSAAADGALITEVTCSASGSPRRGRFPAPPPRPSSSYR
jgi:hypothetical protein